MKIFLLPFRSFSSKVRGNNVEEYNYCYLEKKRRRSNMPGSEIAIVKAAIEQEYTAAKLGLEGLAYGTAKHEFITARTERLADLQRQLVGLSGQNETEAMGIFLQTIEATPETPTRVHIRQELERLQSEHTAHLLDWLMDAC
jgi:hypothetical protein